MANIASQKKRILRSERERAENRLLTSTVKTHFRRLESAAEAGDSSTIESEQRDLVCTRWANRLHVRILENGMGSLVSPIHNLGVDPFKVECIDEGFAHALSTLVIADLLGVPEEEHGDLITLIGLPPTQMGGDAEHKVQSDPLSWLHDRFRGYHLKRQGGLPESIFLIKDLQRGSILKHGGNYGGRYKTNHD